MEDVLKQGKSSRKQNFMEGIRDGIPIGLGYFAVAFSLGIAARQVGMNALQGFLLSLFNNASAGEYAALTVIGANGTYIEIAIITLITNARYLLMSCSLSQKFSPETPMLHRLLVGFDVTDELFGIAIAREGYADPFYSYGAFVPALPGWAMGTAVGIIAGNILPARVVSALSVALFGMFLAIIIPPARENKVIRLFVGLSFLVSGITSMIPVLSHISSGTKIIVLTVILAGIAAYLFPIEDEEETSDEK